MDKNEEIKLNILIKECDSIGQGIRNLELEGEKYITLGFTILAIGLAYGIKENIKLILLILPIAISGVLLYSLHLTLELTSLGGYKRHLEERINSIIGEDILLWESFIAPKRHKTFIKYFLYPVYAIFFVLTSVISLIIAYKNFPLIVFLSISFILVFLTIGLIFSIFKIQRSFYEIYLLIKSR